MYRIVDARVHAGASYRGVSLFLLGVPLLGPTSVPPCVSGSRMASLGQVVELGGVPDASARRYEQKLIHVTSAAVIQANLMDLRLEFCLLRHVHTPPQCGDAAVGRVSR